VRNHPTQYRKLLISIGLSVTNYGSISIGLSVTNYGSISIGLSVTNYGSIHKLRQY